MKNKKVIRKYILNGEKNGINPRKPSWLLDFALSGHGKNVKKTDVIATFSDNKWQ